MKSIGGTLKMFDLSRARLKIAMKDKAILPALLEVTDGDWVFTVVVVVVGDEERRRGSEKGEPTRVAVASHSGQVEEDEGRVEDQRRGGDIVSGKTADKGRREKGGKLDPGLLEVQTSRLAKKKVLHGSRKLCSTFFPQAQSTDGESGVAASPFRAERPRWTAKRTQRQKIQGKGLRRQRKEGDLNNASSDENMEGFLGRVGSDPRGSAVMVMPSSPETRGKGSNIWGIVVRWLRNFWRYIQEEEQMLHRIVRPIGFGSEIRVKEFHMKIISWNTRGLGSKNKRRVVKDFLRSEKPDVVMIQETKKEECDRREEVVLDSFSVSIKFAMDGCESLWLSAVYGPNNSALRKDFWVELSDIVGLSYSRWCVGGDFNVIRRSSEKLGGARSYTWSNMQDNPVCKRLNCFLYSNEWEQVFPQSLQEYCQDGLRIIGRLFWKPIHSSGDQRRSGLRICGCNILVLRRIFGSWWREFQGNRWEGHKFMRKLQFVKAKLKEWNKASVGELSKRKKDILSVLANFDSLEQEGGLSYELLVQRALRKGELEELILREKKYIGDKKIG
ncbi:hypothetical protein CK203_084077 [Vitis vinifera]|uniref:Endonuclease/exonuclease/phosphatase domain-containing protein n=1 Tax=Vitis vinifera TaxID=29760 RepID=A0A438FJX0_VITVI|nr:hypothetical protein CK203_084077 [Vitis vinifera]